MKRFLALIVTLTIVGTHLNLAVSSHFCMGKKVKTAISIGEKEVSCGMQRSEVCKETSSSPEIRKSPCCADELLSFDLDEDFSPDHSDVKINAFLGAFLYVLSFVYEHISDTSSGFVQYIQHIPVLIRNIPVLVSSFLL